MTEERKVVRELTPQEQAKQDAAAEKARQEAENKAAPLVDTGTGTGNE